MLPNRDELQFYTGDPIDKIVQELTIENITNNGATSSPQKAKIVTKNIVNPYGKKCFVRGRWSIDGGSTWNTFTRRPRYNFVFNYSGMFGTFSSDGFGLQAAVSIGVSDSEIKFVTANGYHGDVAQDDVSDTYTPISLDFIIEYTLFEVG